MLISTILLALGAMLFLSLLALCPPPPAASQSSQS